MSRTAIVWAWMVREGVPWPPGAVPGASHGWQGQGQGNSRRTAPRPSWPSCRVRPWGTVPLLYGCLDGPGGCPSPGMEPRPCVLPSPGHCLGRGAAPPRQAAIACASLSARAGAVCGQSVRSNRAAAEMNNSCLTTPPLFVVLRPTGGRRSGRLWARGYLYPPDALKAAQQAARGRIEGRELNTPPLQVTGYWLNHPPPSPARYDVRKLRTPYRHHFP